MSNRSTLESATQDRKARLAQLKSLKRKQAPVTDTTSTSDLQHDDSTAPDERPRKRTRSPSLDVASTFLSGRNYDAATRGPKLGYETAPNKDPSVETLESKAQAIEAETRRQREEEEKADKPLDLFKLQPKRPNWDLKRDLEKKYEVLNVRTENAIAKAVRERVAKAREEAKRKTEAELGEKGEADEDGVAIGMEGAALVEATREMEREEVEEEARRRRVEDDDDDGGVGI